MAIYKVGQDIQFKLPLRILRAFASNDTIYYIVGIRKNNTPLADNQKPLWGVLRVDGSYGAIPPDIMKRAARLVQQENLLKELE